MKRTHPKSPIIRTVFVLFAFIAIVSLLTVGCATQQPNVSQTPSGNIITSNPVPTPPAESGGVAVPAGNKSETQKTQEQIAHLIADGSYEDQVSYEYHSGVETVDIQVTTKNDVVTAASVTGVNSNGMSLRYINAFNAALPDLVVGKKISDIYIPHTVSGSSLTSAAFAQHLRDLIASHPAQ